MEQDTWVWREFMFTQRDASSIDCQQNQPTTKMTIETTEYAQEHGFIQLTDGYKLPREKWMLDNVVKDAQANKKEICLVNSNRGVELWQKPKTQTTQQ
jgi:hypothetical protein